MKIKQQKISNSIVFLTIFLSTTTVLAANMFSQSLEKTFISIALENEKVKTFFDEIERQSDFTFVYASKIKNYEKRLSLKKNSISVREAMDFLAENANLSYQIKGNTISVKKDIAKKDYRKASVLQDVIKGVVKQSNGTPLPGANVLVKGTNRGSVTDFDGNYTIKASSGDVLVFSYVGFLEQEIVVSDQKQIDVVLQEDISTLEQIVVIGYGTSTKKELTTAITSIKAEEIIKDKPFVNVEQSLNGKVAGVQVLQSSGSPGDQTSVRIRGISSINANNEPLYVIDGVQVNNTEGLNPNDIESISILKDAASSAIYGARASNGVVLITTKRGKEGTSSINFSAYLGQNRLINTIEVLNAEQYMDYLNTALVNAGEPAVSDPFNGQFNTDWQKELYAPALLQNYQLSFTGGSEKGTYYLSAGYQQEEGTVESTSFERFSVRFNQDRKVLKNLKIGNSIALTRTDFNTINVNQRVNQGGVILSALQTPTIIPVINDDGTYPDNPFQPGWDNPIALIRGEERSFKTYKSIINVYGEYTFPFGAKLKSSLGIDYNNSKFNRFLDPFTTSNGRANEGEAQNQTFLETVWLWENTFDYKFSLSDEIQMGILLGASAQRSRYEETNNLGRGFVNGSILTVSGAATPVFARENVQEWANNSLFYRLDINYLKRYYLSSSGRRDGSSRFGPDKLYGLFPSISFSWVASSEKFLQNVLWLQTLKVRYSYGFTGNQFIGNYAWRGLYATNDGNNNFGYVINNELSTGFVPTQVENRLLQWEPTEEHNIGIDISLFKNRISFTADAYTKEITQALLPLQLPITTGFDQATVNLGTLTNRGLELGLDTDIISNIDFNWNLTANYSVNENEVKNLEGNVFFGGGINDLGNVVRIEEGQPIGNFYGYVSEGVDPETGNIIFTDFDNNGIINPDDRTIIGNALPDFTWGVTNALKFKGLELIVFFQGVEGQDIFNASRFELENQTSFGNQSATVLDRWTPDNRDGQIPIAVFGDPAGNGRASNRWVEDGSYIKLRELTVGYTFPKKWINKLKISNLKIYAQGRNLYTWTDYKGYDPEVSRNVRDPLSQNIDYGTYPQVKTYIAGFNLRF